jgi:hypothetical protein
VRIDPELAPARQNLERARVAHSARD